MSKEFTKEQMQKMFMDHLMMLRNYWLNESRAPTHEEKLDGFIHSLLVTFDGCSGGHPGIDLVINTSGEDISYAKENGSHYYPKTVCINDDCHMHDMLYQTKGDDDDHE